MMNIIFLATLGGLLDFYASYLHFTGSILTQYDFPPLSEILNRKLCNIGFVMFTKDKIVHTKNYL